MLTAFGFLIMLYAGFKGWKMVQTHHIGVDKFPQKKNYRKQIQRKNANEYLQTLRKTEEKKLIFLIFH